MFSAEPDRRLTFYRLLYLSLSGTLFNGVGFVAWYFAGWEAALWWLAYLLVSGLIPGVVIAYLLYPAITRSDRTNDIVKRTWEAVEDAEQNEKKADTQRRMAGGQAALQSIGWNISDMATAQNYLLPLGFLSMVVASGFFLLLSRGYPLLVLGSLDDLLFEIPNSLFYGFAGGWLYALYSVVSRYRSADIPPGLINELAYQIVIASVAAYFVAKSFPGDQEEVTPLVVFALGFIPYVDITTWLRTTAQTRLGTTGSQVRQKAQERERADSLIGFPGISSQDYDRLREEHIYTVQNMAMANPIYLYLVTSYRMSQIIAWISQAYLRTFIEAEASERLAGMGIRGAIEMARVKSVISQDNEDGKALLAALAKAIDKEEAEARHLVDTLATDPKVEMLRVFWEAFAGT